MAGKQDNRPYALIDLYVLLYTERYKKKPLVNKFRDRWGFTDMIDTVGYDRSVEILKFYFAIDRASHNLSALFNNFDKLDESLRIRDEDRAKRAILRKQTKQRMEEAN